jgi:hypothetical protein
MSALETEERLHRYLNMVSDLQMENQALRKQMEKDTLRFIEEQKRADVAESALREAQPVLDAVESIGSVEWVIIEASLLELNQNKRVRDEVISKVKALRKLALVKSCTEADAGGEEKKK